MAKIQILVEGEIGWDATLGSIRNQYEQQSILAGGADEVEVQINSVGGDVDEGFAIHDYLRSLNAKIITVGVGRVYSIATVILLAGDERKMYENAQFMIHNPWGFGSGSSDELRKFADELDRREDQLAAFYSRITKRSDDEIRGWMNAETFFSAEEAMSFGFVNEVIRMGVEAKVDLPVMKAVAKFKISNSTNMSDTVSVDKGLWDIVKAKIGKALGHSEDVAPVAPVEENDVPETVEEVVETPDYQAQIDSLNEKLNGLLEKNQGLEAELESEKEASKVKDEALEMALAQMKEMEKLPLGSSEKKVVVERKKAEAHPLDSVALALDPNGFIFKK